MVISHTNPYKKDDGFKHPYKKDGEQPADDDFCVSYPPSLWRRRVEEARKAFIQTRAFFLWKRAGQPHGRSLDFWLAAEKEYEKEIADRVRRFGPITDTTGGHEACYVP